MTADATTSRYVVAARLIADADADLNVVSPAIVVDLVWAHARPADRLDHVRARAPDAPGVLDVVLILRAADAREARANTRALCDRATDSPALTRWTLDRIDALQFADLEIQPF